MQAQPPKKRDWSSMAASLIPAVIGGISGGPMGAMAGAGKGLSDISQNEMDVEKYNRELELKNQEEQRRQKQLEINQQQANIYQQQETRMNRMIQEEMKTLELDRKNMQLVYEKNQRSAADEEAYRKKLTPEQLQRRIQYGPEGYFKYEDQERRVASLARVMRTQDANAGEGMRRWGGRNADYTAIARGYGPAGFEAEMSLRANRQSRQATSGPWRVNATNGELYNTISGATLKPNQGSMRPSDRIKLRDVYRKQWAAGPSAFTIDFEDYMRTPLINAEFRRLTGDWTEEQYQSAMPNLMEQERIFRQRAKGVLYQQWQKKKQDQQLWGGPPSGPGAEAEFARFMQTPDGFALYQQAIIAQRQEAGWTKHSNSAAKLPRSQGSGQPRTWKEYLQGRREQ